MQNDIYIKSKGEHDHLVDGSLSTLVHHRLNVPDKELKSAESEIKKLKTTYKFPDSAF